eukprot:g46282.t1
MNQEVHSLLKTRRAAFKSCDPGQYRKYRYDLCKAIRDAKRQYRTKLEAQTCQKDSCCLWQGLYDIMGYKMKQGKIADKDISLPDTLNAFYAQIEQNASSKVKPVPTAPDTSVPSVTTSDIRFVLLGVNPRKAMDPDGVPGRALRSCVDQLAEVFTNIFNLSLLQTKVPTCFKRTTINPVPKKTHTTKKGGEHASIYINRTEVERVNSIKFFRVTKTDNLSRSSHINATVKKAQCLFFHRRLRKLGIY